jgi:hypothetical protein
VNLLEHNVSKALLFLQEMGAAQTVPMARQSEQVLVQKSLLSVGV